MDQVPLLYAKHANGQQLVAMVPHLIKQQQQLRPTQNHYTVLKFICVIVMSKCTIDLSGMILRVIN